MEAQIYEYEYEDLVSRTKSIYFVTEWEKQIILYFWYSKKWFCLLSILLSNFKKKFVIK